MAQGLKFPLIPDEKYKASIFFSAKGTGGSSGGNAILYLPEAISFADGIVYDNVNLNLAGRGVELVGKQAMAAANRAVAPGMGAGQMARAASGAMVNSIKEQVSTSLEQFTSGGSIGNTFEDISAVGSVLAQTAIQGISSDAAEGISAATGITANPHKRSLFRDVSIRNFTFSFLMSPASPEEAAAINEIVRFFRVNAYPRKLGEGLAYEFPTTFDIKFKYKNAEMQDVPKLLPCFLTSINTVFNPRGASFFNDGRFSETQLSLNFVEQRPLDKKEVEAGH